MNFSELLAQAAQNNNNANMSIFASLVSACYAESKPTNNLGSFLNAAQSYDQLLEETTAAHPAVESFVLDVLSESWGEIITEYAERITASDSALNSVLIQGALYLDFDATTVQQIADDYSVVFLDAIDCNLFINLKALKLLRKDLNTIGHSAFGINARSHRDAAILIENFTDYSIEVLESAITAKAPSLLSA